MEAFKIVKKIPGPKLDVKHGIIDLSHGAGGRATARLVEQLFEVEFDNALIKQHNDAACFSLSSGRYVMTCDAHVISPLFFPGGDIGCLSVYGTVNDLAMMGAKPLYLTAAFILEEGFAFSDLKRIVQSMAKAARRAQVVIVAGDTKVVEKGKGDGVFITTTGVGIVPEGVDISGDKAQTGDDVIVNGYIGDHGIAIMSHRENIQFDTTLLSDTAPLNDLVAKMTEAVPKLHCLRDPTRGGLATTLNELAKQSNVGFMIDENKIPVREEVTSACELLGLDPLYVANEGKLVAICPSEFTETLLTVMRNHPLGKEAAVIGKVIADSKEFVQLKTKFGGMRIVDWLTGEQLPRIC